jgi:hypothetical protein
MMPAQIQISAQIEFVSETAADRFPGCPETALEQWSNGTEQRKLAAIRVLPDMVGYSALAQRTRSCAGTARKSIGVCCVGSSRGSAARGGDDG